MTTTQFIVYTYPTWASEPYEAYFASTFEEAQAAAHAFRTEQGLGTSIVERTTTVEEREHTGRDQ